MAVDEGSDVCFRCHIIVNEVLDGWSPRDSTTYCQIRYCMVINRTLKHNFSRAVSDFQCHNALGTIFREIKNMIIVVYIKHTHVPHGEDRGRVLMLLQGKAFFNSGPRIVLKAESNLHKRTHTSRCVMNPTTHTASALPPTSSSDLLQIN